MEEIHWIFLSKYWGHHIQGRKKDHIFCPYWVYSKPFIWTYPYINTPYWQKVQYGTTKATYVPNNRKCFCWDCTSHIFLVLMNSLQIQCMPPLTLVVCFFKCLLAIFCSYNDREWIFPTMFSYHCLRRIIIILSMIGLSGPL